MAQVACLYDIAAYESLGGVVTRWSGAVEIMEATEAMLPMAVMLPWQKRDFQRSSIACLGASHCLS